MTTVVPSAGQSPDFLQLGPGASASYGAIDLRRAAGAGLQEGVIGASGGAYKVTLSSGMILTIAASTVDGALVQGDTISAQGLYFVPPHSAAITETVTAAHATLPRIDTVVLEVLDANHDGGGSNLARTRIIAGTATSGATLDNRTGAAALPSSATLLADVLVPAAAASILAGNIRDRRKQAMGSFWVVQRNGTDYTTTGTSMGNLDATNLYQRLECSGVTLRVAFSSAWSNSAANALNYAGVWLDGAIATGMTDGVTSGQFYVNAGRLPVAFSAPLTPVAGSHLLGIAWRVNSTTGTMFCNANAALTVEMQEIVRPSVANT
jgi:hypothetical protein